MVGAHDRHIYPLECRQRKVSYKGKCNIQVHWSVNGIPRAPIDKDMGELPIMVKVVALKIGFDEYLINNYAFSVIPMQLKEF